ncbi:MAG: helix-turn-helix domain-containing protein [Pseudomonadales bacterium]|nr:helix-turn-helix domain-containing protein [Pseudomonadales bacterium]
MGTHQVRRTHTVADPVLLTEDEAAQLLKIQPATLACWRVKGRPHLPFVRVGRCVRYRRQDILVFIERHLAESTAGPA